MSQTFAHLLLIHIACFNWLTLRTVHISDTIQKLQLTLSTERMSVYLINSTFTLVLPGFTQSANYTQNDNYTARISQPVQVLTSHACTELFLQSCCCKLQLHCMHCLFITTGLHSVDLKVAQCSFSVRLN